MWSSTAVRAAAAPALPATSYPDPARSADGGDPLAPLPKPDECPAAGSGAPPPGYVRLTRLPQRKADDPFVKGEPASVVLRFVNRKGQRFRLFVSARTDATIRRYIKGAAVCFEWIRLLKPLPPVLNPVLLDEPLVAAAVELTDRSRDSLTALQRSLPAPATFADVITASGRDPAAVVESAASVVSSKLEAKVAAGELTAAEVAALDVPELLRQLVEQPDAPFLFGSSELPSGAEAAGRFLRADKRGSVLVTMQALGKVPQRSWIWYGVDPNINDGTTHNYKAKCTTSASVEIFAWAGKAAVKLWREPSPVVGTRTATAAVGSSGWLHHQSGGNRTYDTNVKGKQDGSNYSIHGGWKRASGGGC